MFEVFKSVIIAGGFKLAEIQHKIKKMYVLGDLTEAQMDELLAMACGGASADAERPEALAMMKAMSERMDGLEARLKALEGGAEEGTEQPEFPVWEAWDGLSNKYQKGAVVQHNGQLWESIFNGQNVWQPGAAGTESLWIPYTPASEETE